MDLDLKQLLLIVRRWWWLLLVIPLLFGGLMFAVSSRQTPMYSSTATIRVNALGSAAQDVNALRASQDLTETFRQLIVLPPVLNDVVDTLNLPYPASDLESKVTATTVRDTQLVRISVSDPDPEQAALIANTIASAFAQYVADESLNLIQLTRSGLDQQIADIEDEVDALDSQIADLDVPANEDTAAIQTELADLRSQRSTLQQQIADLEVEGQTVSLGLASAQSQVTVAAQAQPATSPYEPRTLFMAVLGGFVGIMVAVGVVALLQYLDNSVSAETDFQQLAGTPMLAAVAAQSDMRPGGHQVFVLADPRSASSEAVRLLRANLEFAFAGRDVKTLTITSPNMGEGKSTISANIAVVMAQAGLKTVLIDADLRKPTQHRIFSLPNENGLTALLTHPDLSWDTVAHRVAVPNLSLIPAGVIPPNPSDLLSIDRFPEVLAAIGAESDIVIIDTPPVTAVADPLVVARKTDACILVIKAGSTRRDSVQECIQVLQQGGAKTLGVVLNQQKLRSSSYYYAYETKDEKGRSKSRQPA